MKKTVLSFGFILLLVVGSYFFFTSQDEHSEESKDNRPSYTDKDKDKLKKLDSIHEKLDYFHMDLFDRYLAYHEKNSSLPLETVITYVNIGLDQPYYTNTKVTPYLNQIYILSNKYLSMPSDYVPNNLETISSQCSRSGMRLVSEAREQFETLCSDAKDDGYTIRAMSSYRSYDYQVDLYQRYVDRDGKDAADTYSARPGFSEHQTGLVVDVDNRKLSYTQFDETQEYGWMKEHAHEYGFIERYPEGKEDITGYSYESWHYRYVGREIATYMKEHDMTFDEYYVQFIEGKK